MHEWQSLVYFGTVASINMDAEWSVMLFVGLGKKPNCIHGDTAIASVGWEVVCGSRGAMGIHLYLGQQT